MSNKISSNPFSDAFVKKEIQFYGLSEYDKDGIKIETTRILGRCDDYLNVNFRDGSLHCPRFFIDKLLWMSLTPMEIQSHYIPIGQARGKIGIGGLGMGYFLLKVMEKDAVKSIDVYEIETRATTFFIKNFKNRKGFDKVNFIIGDIHKTMENKKYDFVYMDIYSDMLSDSVISDKILFLKNNKIIDYHFWCQEKVFKQAYEYGLLSLEDLPFDVKLFFMKWSASKGARLRDHEISQEFIEKCLETFNLFS